MSIEALALEVISLKKAASEALAEGDLDRFMTAVSLEIRKQKQLRLDVTTHNFIEAKSKAVKDLLRKIRLDVAEEEQAMGEILKKIADQGTCGLLVEDAADIDELAGKLLYSWFYDREYVWGLFRSGAVVIRCRVPYELESLVQEARQCFAFQQYNAVISLCRTILETAVTDIGVRLGQILKSALDHHDFYKQYPPWQRIDAVAAGPLRARMHKFYDKTSAVIHGRTNAGSSAAMEALKAVLSMIEELYSDHGDAIRKAQMPAANKVSIR